MFGARLKLLREKLGINQNELAQKLDVSASAIGMYETNKREPNNELIIKISDFFDVSIDYLLGKTDIPDKLFYMCPVYGQISAGQPNWAEECIEGRIPIDHILMNIKNPEEHFFLRVNGESMNKIIKNGAFALIHKQDFVENGDIAVVLIDNQEATLKRFTKTDDIIILSPESTDDSFKPLIFTKNTPIKIIGKYISKYENYEKI